MKKTINFGKIDYLGNGRKNCAVTLDIELRSRGGEINPATKERIYTGETTPIYTELSICGAIWNTRHTNHYCGGQCLDIIAKYIKTPLFNELYNYWNLYHLNGMHPDCEHQEALGWRDKAKNKVVLYTFKLTPETMQTMRKLEEMAVEAAKRGEPLKTTTKERFILNLKYSITTPSANVPANMANFYELQKTEEKALGWLRENEHPDGLLCKSCPVCGYKYGTEWKRREIPANVLNRINEIINEV